MIICLALGIISILYGIAVMRVASGTMFFMVWFLIGACFILLGLGIRAHLFSLLPKAVKALLLVLIAAGVLMLCITCTLIGSHFHDKGNKKLDYLIVLGAQVKIVSQDETGSGSGAEGIAGPSTVLRYRLEAAADYLKENPDTVCVVSGGKSPSEPEAEGDVMAEWLAAHGIDAGRIEEGALADIALIDVRKPAFVPDFNFLSNYVLAADSSCVDTLICGGRILMENRKVEGEEEIMARAGEEAHRLMRKARG